MHYADNEMWGQGSLVVGLFTVGSAQLKTHKHVLLLTPACLAKAPFY